MATNYKGAGIIGSRIVPLTNGAFTFELMTASDQDHMKRVAEGTASPNVLQLMASPEMLDRLARQIAQAQEAAKGLNSHGAQNN